MDSPSEFSGFALRTFQIAGVPGQPLFRLAVHHPGTDAELDAFARDVQKIVREARHVFGEYPAFEGNTYTFIADYLPWASGDGMEHRNSTVLSSPDDRSATNRLGLLGSIVARVLPRRGTSSGSGRGRSSRSTSKMRTCRASSGSPKGSPTTTSR